MLKSEDWCGQYWGLHLEFVGLNPWHEILHEWNARVQQILEYKHHKSWGADCAVSSLEIGGPDCEPSTQSWSKTSIRMATACEKGGQETKHMAHKN